METTENYLPPGDPKLVANIVNHLKAQGIFDQFRHDCLADVDTKPSYQNLRQRVDGFVSKLLSNETWSPELNKNQLRNDIRRQIDESGMLALGVEHVVEQVVNAKIYQVFLPKIEVIVREYLSKIEQVKEDVSNDKKCDSVDGTQKADTRAVLVDKPVEILKEVTGECLTKFQKSKEDSGNHESLTLDRLIRPEVEKNVSERRGGLSDRIVDTKLSAQVQNIDLKQAEHTERKESVDPRKTPDPKSESRIVNSKLRVDTNKNKPEADVIKRLDKSWLKQREKARLKYEEPAGDSSERNVYDRDNVAMSPEKNKVSSQDDLSKHSDSTKNKKSEDSGNLRSTEKGSKHKTSSSKIHGSKTKTDSAEESKNESKSTSVSTKPSKSSDSGSSDTFKNTSSEGSRTDIKSSPAGSSKSSKSTELKNREASKNFKARTDYEKVKSFSKSELKSKTNKYSSEISSSGSKLKSEKRDSDSSKKVETSLKQGSKKEKDDKNKYLKKELSVEKKLQEYNRLTEQKTVDGRVRRESSISSQGSTQEIRNNEFDGKHRSKSDSRKTKSQMSEPTSNYKGATDGKSNDKIKTRVISDIPEGLKKQDFKRSSPVDLIEGKSSSNSSTRESLFASSESDNFDESGQSSGSSITEKQRRELCSDGRRCNTPPSSQTSTSSRESRNVESKSYYKNTDSPTKKNYEHPPSNTKTECLSSDTVSNSLNDSMFLSSASSSSDESFLSNRSIKERHNKIKISQEDDGNKSDGAWSDLSSVSSVHTSDLSSFDDQISLSSSDEENAQKTRKGRKKKRKKRLSLKQVKLIAEEKETGSVNNEVLVGGKQQSAEVMSPGQKQEMSSKAVVPGCSDSKNYSSSDEDTGSSHVMDTNTKNGRKRKRNSKYASRDFSSVFSPNKRADTRKSTDRSAGDFIIIHHNFVADSDKKGSSEWDKGKKLSPMKVPTPSEEKGESDGKSHPLVKMDIHSSIRAGNDSSSDFSDIISDDLSSDDEKDVHISTVKSETAESRKISSESSTSSDDTDEEITEEKIHPKRKYVDSSEPSDTKEMASVVKNGHHDHDNTNAGGSYRMYSSGGSNAKTEKSESKDFNSNVTGVSVSDEVVPRKRGRPRKYPVGHVYVYCRPVGDVKRDIRRGDVKRRGRPRKHPVNDINDSSKSRVDNTASPQKADSLPSCRSSSAHSKEGQVRRKSQEKIGTRRNSRRLSAGSENSEQPSRPLRRSSDHSSSDMYRNDTSYNRGDTQHSTKWYDSSDLYKPRPIISSSSRRSRAHLP